MWRPGAGRPGVRGSAAYPGGVSDASLPDSELVSRLRIIEEQPLATRAAAYASVHDELARRLDSDPERGTVRERAE